MLQVGYLVLSFFARRRGRGCRHGEWWEAATSRIRHQAEGERPYGPLGHHEP